MYLPKNGSLPITLKSKEFELFTIVPVKKLGNGVAFAPIGLVKMFNSGGAIKCLKYEADGNVVVEMKVRGCGTFGAYSSHQPKRVVLGSEEVDFEYSREERLVRLELGVPKNEAYQWDVRVEF